MKRMPEEWSLQVDPEFRDLIRPLTADEYKGLEESLIAEGCREPITAWGNIVLDGHNRLEICTRLGIPFAVRRMSFDSREDALLWEIDNQCSRRNLEPYERTRLQLKRKPLLEAKARERQRGGQGGLLLKESTKANTRKAIADAAGVSEYTVQHVQKIEKEAPQAVIDAVRDGEIKIETAYNITKMKPEEQDALIKAVNAGETTLKEAVKNMRKDRQPNHTGLTKAERQSRAETVNLSAMMRSAETLTEYSVDMLIEEIRTNGENFVHMIDGILNDRREILDGGREAVASAFDSYIMNGLEEIRRKIA